MDSTQLFSSSRPFLPHQFILPSSLTSSLNGQTPNIFREHVRKIRSRHARPLLSPLVDIFYIFFVLFLTKFKSKKKWRGGLTLPPQHILANIVGHIFDVLPCIGKHRPPPPPRTPRGSPAQPTQSPDSLDCRYSPCLNAVPKYSAYRELIIKSESQVLTVQCDRLIATFVELIDYIIALYCRTKLAIRRSRLCTLIL